MLVTQAAIPHLRKTKGWIVNLASIAGTQPVPILPIYAATKAAVISLTHSLNADLDDDGVRAIAICPGFVDTPMAEFAGPRGRRDDPARGLRRGRADVPPAQPARTRAAGRDRARRLERQDGLGGFGGLALVAGVRWSFRGKDAGAPIAEAIGATRTQHRGDQRGPVAQPLLRQTLLAQLSHGRVELAHGHRALEARRILPSEPTRKTHGSVGRLHSRTHSF